jgi:hypothetical protein
MAPAAAGRLLRSDEPSGSALAGARALQRLRIGRTDLIEGSEPVTLRCCARTEREWHLEQ